MHLALDFRQVYLQGCLQGFLRACFQAFHKMPRRQTLPCWERPQLNEMHLPLLLLRLPRLARCHNPGR